MVMLALATVLGAAYVLLGTASTSASLDSNSTLANDALYASKSGGALSYQNTFDSAWAGVGTGYSQAVGDGVSYEVSYQSGDASLPASDPSQPYLVTITVVGTADNPSTGSANSTFTSKMVVALVPKTPDDQPADWSDFLNYTVYQTGPHNTEIDFPARVEGNLRLQKTLKFCDWYPLSKEDLGGTDILFVVTNKLLMTSPESARFLYLASIGFTVHLIDESDSQSTFNAAIANNDVVYISEEVEPSNVNSKVSQFPIGVVNEEQALNDELGTSSSGGTVNDRTQLEITGPAHFITQGYLTGSTQTIFSSNQEATRISGTLSPDLQILGRSVLSGSTSYDSLGALDSAARNWNSGYTTSRRVQLPWGGNSFDSEELTSLGKTLLVRSLTWASTENARRRLFRDLTVKHLSGGSDHRPLSGDVHFPYSWQDAETTGELEDWLGLTTHDISISGVQSDWLWLANSAPTSYQLYAKGKTYAPEAISTGSLANTTLSASPDNPLGIFTRVGHLSIGNNVTVNGTILCSGKVDISGTNVTLTPVTMKSTDPASYAGMRIPTLVCGGGFGAGNGCAVTAQGLFISFKEFTVTSGDYGTTFDLEGHVVCAQKFVLGTRTEWAGHDFTAAIKSFMNQATHVRFPDYLNSTGLNPTPLIVIRQPTLNYEYHWIDPASPDPLYKPTPETGGFEFEIVRVEQ
jgi:hypothetical protein